ncbi:MAG TPA: D-alanyl-D-alanine carboxypeptidase family protein [Clostridiales bacterium]|nr:D-alanyl-D-alanine carboxypeptidase family protein [Clostridiales bacterium]
MNMTKKLIYILIAVITMIGFCSVSVFGETDADAQSDAAVTNPAYSDKAYTAVMDAFNAYDARSETAPGLDVSAAILMDAGSGRVLYELCPDELRYPASMTKLMTLLVTLDAIDAGQVSYDDVVTFSEAAVAEDGSKTGCPAGTTDTLKHVLEMMMVCSANDAAYVVAETVGGDVATFAALMNAKAKALGMEHTNYVNPNGLHAENHYMTARDMATLCRNCINNETVMYFCSLASTTLPTGTVCYNTNKLLFWYEGCDGFKTGTTEAAGHCLATTAERDGMRLIAVVMGGTYDYSHYINGMKLLEYGFANYTLTTLVEKGSVLAKADVVYGKEDTVGLIAESDILYPVKSGETVTPEIVTDIAESIEGPAKAGLDGGNVVVKIDGKEVGSCDLVTETMIHKRTVFHWLKDFFSALVSSV